MKTIVVKANEPTQVYNSRVGVSATAGTAFEYSVDGINYTRYKDVLEAGTNVIANVPEGLYLKFDKDVIICY